MLHIFYPWDKSRVKIHGMELMKDGDFFLMFLAVFLMPFNE